MSKRFEVGDTCGVFDLESNDHEYCLNDIEVCELLNNQAKRISDLEAKLAESEELLKEELEEKNGVKRALSACNRQNDEFADMIKKLVSEKKELKQQLFESGLKNLEEIKLSEQRKKMLEDLSTKNWELEQQLGEKDEEIKDLNYRLDLKFVNYTNSESIKFLEDQDKISFAVEQLECLKKKIPLMSAQEIIDAKIWELTHNQQY